MSFKRIYRKIKQCLCEGSMKWNSISISCMSEHILPIMAFPGVYKSNFTPAGYLQKSLMIWDTWLVYSTSFRKSSSSSHLSITMFLALPELQTCILNCTPGNSGLHSNHFPRTSHTEAQMVDTEMPPASFGLMGEVQNKRWFSLKEPRPKTEWPLGT